MLRQRVVTAVVLLAVLLPALFAASPWPFVAVTGVAICAAAWEWARLNQAAGWAWPASVAMGIACFGGWQVGWVESAPPALWWLSVPVWVVGGGWLLHAGAAGWHRLPAPARLVLGLAVLFLGWLALASTRADGINRLLSVFCLVWTADIAAYFAGRAFGRRKLAPTISPGKSWEGVVGGVVGVLGVALLWLWIDRSMPVDSPSVYTLLVERLGVLPAVMACVFLAAMSVVGDLVESLIKRAAGAKDSSRLLPGHGGVLDRIDALLPVLPLALALKSW